MTTTITAPPTDFALEAAAGRRPGVSTENKYGANPVIDTATTPEDVWPQGGVIVLPTAPRIHDLSSSDPLDTLLGTGLRTCRIFGLKTWDDPESSEVIEMNGVTDVPTADAYVIIHRIEALTWGALGLNAGLITAVAQVDGTLTCVVAATDNQTLMAIYGVPSVQAAYVTSYWASFGRPNPATTSAEVNLLANTTPDVDPNAGFRIAQPLDLFSAGTTYINHVFNPPKRFPGPVVLKVQVPTVGANATRIKAGFDLYTEDN